MHPLQPSCKQDQFTRDLQILLPLLTWHEEFIYHFHRLQYYHPLQGIQQSGNHPPTALTLLRASCPFLPRRDYSLFQQLQMLQQGLQVHLGMYIATAITMFSHLFSSHSKRACFTTKITRTHQLCYANVKNVQLVCVQTHIHTQKLKGCRTSIK